MDAMTRDPTIMLLGGIQYVPHALTPNTVEPILTFGALPPRGGPSRARSSQHNQSLIPKKPDEIRRNPKKPEGS